MMSDIHTTGAEERMASYDLSIVNADVVLPGGEPARVDLGVSSG
jgi:hypothetical protein